MCKCEGRRILEIYFIRKKFACFRKEKDGEIIRGIQMHTGQAQGKFFVFFSAVYRRIIVRLEFGSVSFLLPYPG